jgi:hypothetical protein
MNPESYENSIAALVGVSASIKDSNPMLAASIKWALRGIQDDHDALKLRADNCEYLLRETMEVAR